MQKRTIYSLLLISFMVVFSASASFANQVLVQSKNASRCAAAVSNAINVTAVVSSDSVSAVEVVLEITGNFTGIPSVTFDAGLTQLDNRVIDLTQANGVSPDTVRFAAMRTVSTDAALLAGTKVIARINVGTANVCAGIINLNNGVFTYPNPVGVITTQFVNAANSSLLPVAVTNGVVTLVNAAPVLASIPDATLPWGTLYTGSASATDADQANCEKLTYAKQSGPLALNVNATSGAISWLTTGNDVCVNTVVVKVTDSCGATDLDTFAICVTNVAPTITCVAPVLLCGGEQLNVSVTGADSDLGPRPLIYSLASTTAPGVVLVDPATGQVTWDPGPNSGSFSICVAVTDSAKVCSPCSPSNADTCCFTVNVLNNDITIEGVANQGQGEFTTVDVSMNPFPSFNTPMGGFDFLIRYDASALSFQKAEPGQFILDCGWEYFTYRFGPNGNCGNSGCPQGFLRIVAIAETNNGGANHPDCFVNGSALISNQLAILTFFVSNNRTFECQWVPIDFFWYDCGDNALSTISGDSLIISSRVYASNGVGSYYQIDTLSDGTLPSAYGAVAPLCDVYTAKGQPVRCVDFYSGGIAIICADSIDARGDINLNGIYIEIADVVMFTNYFTQGLSAFTTHVNGSIAASDVNADGTALTVADLVLAIRIVVGDAAQNPKLDLISVNANQTGDVWSVNGVNLGGVAMTVAGNVVPKLLAENMGMEYLFDGTNTRIIIVPMIGLEGNETAIEKVTGFTGAFIEVAGSVTSIEMADIYGNSITVNKVVVPTAFALSQNYPNPFNPKTNISLALPNASDYTLTIYNVQGQVVQTFEGHADAGYKIIEWDASNVASGIYFYKVNAGTFSEVKKAVLLK